MIVLWFKWSTYLKIYYDFTKSHIQKSELAKQKSVIQSAKMWHLYNWYQLINQEERGCTFHKSDVITESWNLTNQQLDLVRNKRGVDWQ
jgi:hypothetical protein